MSFELTLPMTLNFTTILILVLHWDTISMRKVVYWKKVTCKEKLCIKSVNRQDFHTITRLSYQFKTSFIVISYVCSMLKADIRLSPLKSMWCRFWSLICSTQHKGCLTFIYIIRKICMSYKKDNFTHFSFTWSFDSFI